MLFEYFDAKLERVSCLLLLLRKLFVQAPSLKMSEFLRNSTRKSYSCLDGKKYKFNHLVSLKPISDWTNTIEIELWENFKIFGFCLKRWRTIVVGTLQSANHE